MSPASPGQRRATKRPTPGYSTERLIRSFHMGLWGACDVSAIDRFVASGAATEMSGLHGSSVDVLRENSSAMSLHSTT